MSEVDLPERLRRIVGTELTPGNISVPASEAAMLTDVLGTPVPSDQLHPVYAYIASQRGIGVSVAELCAIAEFDIDDGPMLGSIDFQYPGQMRADTEYRVEGTILDITRKQGRAMGVFDLLDFEWRIVERDGTVVTTCRCTFVLPRKEFRA